MKKVLMLLTLLSAASFAEDKAAPAEASIAGNGGGLVECRKGQDNPFDGLQSLDYVATYVKSNQNKDIVPVKSWEESAARVLKNLKAKDPTVAANYENFVSHIDNYTDYSKDRIWVERPWGLETIHDQGLSAKLPPNCKNEDGSFKYVQLVRRTQQRGQITYEFALDPYKEIRKNKPLDFAFAMDHEFWRDYTQSPELIRKMVRIFHSDSFDAYDAPAFRSIMSRQDFAGKEVNWGQLSQEELDKRLMEDARLGNADFAKHWIELGASPNARNYEQTTALMSAAMSNSLEIAKLLVEKDAYIQPVDKYGRTALLFAAGWGSGDVMRYLIDKGANLDTKTTTGMTALINALTGGREDLALELIKAGADVHAVTKNDDSYSDPWKGYSALLVAAFKGYEKAGKALLEKNADALLKNPEYKTALMLAMSAGKSPGLALALVPKSDVNAVAWHEWRNTFDLVGSSHSIQFTPLMLAAAYGYADVAKALIEAGSEVNYAGQETGKNTALMFAALEGKVDTIKVLIDSGADVNQANSKGNTALYFAANNNQLEAMKALIDAKADLRHRNEGGETVYGFARSNSKASAFLEPYFQGHPVEVSGQGLVRAGVFDWCGEKEKEAARVVAALEALSSCRKQFTQCEASKKETTIDSVKKDGLKYCRATAYATGLDIGPQ